MFEIFLNIGLFNEILISLFQEGNVTTEIHDMTEGKGHLSTDEILGKTGGQAGQHTEVGPDGKTYTYSVEVEEVRQGQVIKEY